ncbi:MAG TPA: TIGR00269 family protein [Candidatus Nanoarchaeia archaeon]|nr:TIGR00269 family protein [Candidatus Nanoarchaeia archaeon]
MMASCELCLDRAVFSSPNYCKAHFIDYIENKVETTIKRFHLIKPEDKIAVAVSGGKDSQTVTYILHKLFGNVTAISIDEGIPGYRDATLKDMKTFCATYNIPHHIFSFEQAFGKKLDTMLQQGAPACRSCGVLRRNLLNKHAQGFDKIATGHNLDDECQSLMMNFLKGTLFLSAKMGPASGVHGQTGFVQRIKPLYFCPEKEITAYAYLMGFPVRFNECPHAADGFRSKVRYSLNVIEQQKTGTKLRMVENFISILPTLKKVYAGYEMKVCTSCAQPSAHDLCKACTTIEVLHV